MKVYRLKHKQNGSYYVSPRGITLFLTEEEVWGTVKNEEWYRRHFKLVEYRLVPVGK